MRLLARVKADRASIRPPTFPVMNLNLVKDFQTGVYDYNLMLGSFVSLQPVNQRPAGFPTKASFSSQEWCGQVYEQLLFDPSSIRSESHSYFDGEADRKATVDYPANGISADTLLLWARGMTAPVLQPGEERTTPLLRSLETVRLGHQPLAWADGKFSRAAIPETIRVPAGAFKAEVRRVRMADGFVLAIWTEQAAPHRILRWETTQGSGPNSLGAPG